MPRPPEGYRNRAGQQVPGVHDITSAYMPKPALVGWAYSRGKQGLPLYEKGTLDIGTAVHAMAELDLRGRPPREIEAALYKALSEGADIIKARNAFVAFTEWREHFAVKPIAQEVTIVSETHQLGGTPDCIASIQGEVGLLDFKTCTTPPKQPYHEQVLAMAAHATLWSELHPDQAIRSCHLIYLPKDGSAPRHHAYANHPAHWGEFACLLAAFAAKNGTPKPRDTRDAEIAPLTAAITAISKGSQETLLNRAKPRARKRYVRPKHRPAPAQLMLPPPIAPPPPLHEPMTMAELLRAYGHVPR
jgi:hypothetical protein